MTIAALAGGALWVGFMLGQLAAYHWYFHCYEGALRDRVFRTGAGPAPGTESVSGADRPPVTERLADRGKRRLEALDRKPKPRDMKLFSTAIVIGFLALLRKHLDL